MAALLTADQVSPGSFGQPQWGIFTQDGDPVLVGDAVNSVEYARDYRISDYPQERGAFASYNKVRVPYQAKVGFLIAETRADFLNNVEQTVASLNLVFVTTPEITYPNANLTHYNYRRVARNGVTLILVEVWCEEIRIVAPPTTTTVNPTTGTTGTAEAGATATGNSVAGGSNSAAGSATAGAGAAGNAPFTADSVQSTNGASPTQSAQVQATPGGTNGSTSYGSGPDSITSGAAAVGNAPTNTSGASGNTSSTSGFFRPKTFDGVPDQTFSGMSSSQMGGVVNQGKAYGADTAIVRPKTLNGDVDVKYYDVPQAAGMGF